MPTISHVIWKQLLMRQRLRNIMHTDRLSPSISCLNSLHMPGNSDAQRQSFPPINMPQEEGESPTHTTASPPTFANINDAPHINLLPSEHQQLLGLSISLQHRSTLSSEATPSALPSDSCLPNKSFPMRYVMSELAKATVV